MKKCIKTKIKSAFVAFIAMCIIPHSYALAYGDNVITDPFSSKRPDLDVNPDGEFDIRDLVNLKKYTNGEMATVDLSVFSSVDGADWEQAMITVRKALLKK